MHVEVSRQVETSAVTAKGQVVIPSGLRRRYGIKKGTRVFFVESGQGLIFRLITNGYIASIRGSLGSKGKAMRILLREKKRERKV